MLGLRSSAVSDGNGNSSDSLWIRITRNVRKNMRKSNKAIMRSYRPHIPYNMPIRLRPWFLVFAGIIMLILAFLGFTNFSHALPLNDKLLHFVCLCIATGVFYFIFDVEEDARRIWFWRSAPLIFTAVTCFLLGGIVSEFVQSMLPYKEFQIGDVMANLLGSSLGLYVAYYLERYYRSRREISRLYQPLNNDATSSEDEDDLEDGATQLLPSHYQPSSNSSRGAPKDAAKTDAGMVRLGDVWDEGEEVFDIGGDSEYEDDEGSPSRPHGHTSPVQTPKIVLTSAES